MPKYEMEIEVPLVNDPEKLALFIEGLRAFGHPTLVWRVEAPNRREACAETANELSTFWPQYDDEFFNERLKAIRGKRAEQDI